MNNLKSSGKFQVYFFTSRAHKPFHLAVHPWVVTVHNGNINRWEIIHREYGSKERSGFVYKNFYTNPTQGIKKYPESTEYWDSRIIGSIVGGDNSLAEKMVCFIEQESFNYPNKDVYKIFPGPNSNTFIQWILNQFPESKIKLPWNAFGKRYK